MYRKKHRNDPVLITDNANKLPEEDLWSLQDYTKLYSDEGTGRVVFVTSEGSLPRHMMGKSILCINCLYAD